MSIKDLAPTVDSVGITQNQINTYFENLPDPKPAPVQPEITKAKVVALANLVFDGSNGVEKHGGFGNMAVEVGLTKAQVKTLVAEMNALLADYRQEGEAKIKELSPKPDVETIE